VWYEELATPYLKFIEKGTSSSDESILETPKTLTFSFLWF